MTIEKTLRKALQRVIDYRTEHGEVLCGIVRMPIGYAVVPTWETALYDVAVAKFSFTRHTAPTVRFMTGANEAEKRIVQRFFAKHGIEVSW